MEELRDRYYGGEGQSRDAFEELCAMYDAIQVFRIYDTSLACISLEILVQRPFTSINRFVVTMSIKWNDLEHSIFNDFYSWHFISQSVCMYTDGKKIAV